MYVIQEKCKNLKIHMKAENKLYSFIHTYTP